MLVWALLLFYSMRGSSKLTSNPAPNTGSELIVFAWLSAFLAVFAYTCASGNV